MYFWVDKIAFAKLPYLAWFAYSTKDHDFIK